MSGSGEYRNRTAPETDGAAELRAQRLLATRAARLAARHENARHQNAAKPAGENVLACRIGPETYGLPLAALAGVIPFTGCAPPLTPQPGVLGILARAGRIYSVVEAASALGLPAAPTEGGHLLLMRGTAARIALRVDRALGLMTVLPRSGEEAAPSRSGIVRYATIHRDEADASAETLLGLVDPARLLLSFTAPPSLPGV